MPRPGIDTGAGLERLLSVLQDVPSVWETDALRPIIAAAEEATGRRYGADGETDVALRILADHARAITFLISDGVFTTNDRRGYVLRVIRRLVLKAGQLGVTEVVTRRSRRRRRTWDMPTPGSRGAGLVETVLAHEEEAFRRTLRAGGALIDEGSPRTANASRATSRSACTTPTTDSPSSSPSRSPRPGVVVDRESFERHMQAQRAQARRLVRGPGNLDPSFEQWRTSSASSADEFRGSTGS